MTWVVATIVIIVVLLFSKFLSISAGTSRGFLISSKSDLLVTKSLIGFLKSDGVVDELNSVGELKEGPSCDLARTIFDELYAEDYPAERWFGVFGGGGQSDCSGTPFLEDAGFVHISSYFNDEKKLTVIFDDQYSPEIKGW